MAESESLMNIVPELIDSIAHKQPVILKGMNQQQLVSMLPALTRHKLESIALLSMPKTSAINTFYLQTYHRQFLAVRSRLANTLKTLNCLFLQGFPRCLDFASFYTPGMRTDIDLYVPAASYENARDAIRSAGFNYYGFDNERIFVLDDEQSSALKARHWANKDVALTLLEEVELPADLPILIEDCYLPYVLRNGKAYLFISLEIHHRYTDESDIAVLETCREPWPQMGVDRCDTYGTMYFNLIRLHRGVFAGEPRLRLLLDTACLLRDPHRPLDMDRLARLIEDSPCKTDILSVCTALAAIHPLFAALPSLTSTSQHNQRAHQWLKHLEDSLSIEPEHA
jgi:hypothetical protein